MHLNRRAFEIAAIAIALVLLGVMGWLLAGARGLLLANGQPVFGDFIAFWSAGRAALDGHAAQVHDVATIGAYHQKAVPGVAYVAPWNSPPTFLLIAAGLAALPYSAAALVFLGVGGAVYFAAARKLAPGAMIFAATLPAALYHLGTVQTGLLIAGVSGLALYWLDRRPLLAGALVSVLAIKPHLALLWPLLLALSGRWRAFAAAAAATGVFVLLAGWTFGFEAYGRFLENLAASQAMISGQRITTPAYASLYASMLGFGAPQWLAAAAQGASAVAALFVFWRTARVIPDARSAIRNPGGERTVRLPLGSGFAADAAPRNDQNGGALAPAGAAMCAATLLMSPYLFFYDFTLLAVGAALLGAPRDRFELAALVLAWGAGLSIAVGYVAPLPLCPLAAWVVLIAAFRRRGSAAVLPAPAPRM
jgi:hypothetical protein